MKKFKKIGALITIFFLNFYNTCFADLVDPKFTKKGGLKSTNFESDFLNYILIGILVLVVVTIAIIIIYRIIKNQKEQKNDINK